MFQVLKKASDIPEYSFLHAYNSFLIKTLNPLHLNQGYNFLVTGMITCLLVYTLHSCNIKLKSHSNH